MTAQLCGCGLRASIRPLPDPACVDMRLPFLEILAVGDGGIGREDGMLRGGFGHGVASQVRGWGPGRLVGERGVGQAV